jgi:EAL domain-containing protein (putative c-di-GMP-specific phosphodiesterase class I)
VFLDGSPSIVASLSRLREFGVRIALDDFGTGYSSLSHLRAFPVDVIKIDRSFAAGLGVSRNDKILGDIASLGTSLDMKVVAEGVEEAEELEAARSVGCTHVQGFLLSPAVEAHLAAAIISNGFASLLRVEHE